MHPSKPRVEPRNTAVLQASAWFLFVQPASHPPPFVSAASLPPAPPLCLPLRRWAGGASRRGTLSRHLGWQHSSVLSSGPLLRVVRLPSFTSRRPPCARLMGGKARHVERALPSRIRPQISGRRPLLQDSRLFSPTPVVRPSLERARSRPATNAANASVATAPPEPSMCDPTDFTQT